MNPSSPVIIGFDGSPAAERALRGAGALLAPRPALVVVVWEAGRAYDVLDIPTLEAPVVPLDIRTATEIDLAMADAAQRLAQHGASLARELGLAAEGLAVADDMSVADTLIRLAKENSAPALVVGSHGHGQLRDLVLGGTARSVVQHAPCPVVVVRGERGDRD
jgi:nucleotide-binding universal stress UspA family protein